MKVGRETLVADYTDLKAIPCVPPLIVHCSTEIEKRSINDNVYREIAESAKVEKLINKILNSESGMPFLQSENIVNVYGAVKHFLFIFDEPLITTVLWRDFARSTDLVGERKEDMIRINVSDLPIPNKDTIAYIILHLNRILLKISNEKQKHSLIKVFSKMMIGNSIINQTTHILEDEAAKQEKIMQSLLDLSDDY
ncbi:rac GTPase-activating protein 1-like protein [Leptotrombidium deliense]|uniref:Rac GTPase-activating protein 1-like protein n=1 Tax=Leptotrombidium deliense TaxID=299467 RepID=A0A443RUD1_9ACAR|nr:rac GTPase-activating protein 1-like protein [Leptotrombidium deliense]